MLARLNDSIAFKYVVLPILFLLALFASVYAYSTYCVYRDSVAYGDPYEPPPPPKMNLKDIIMQRQLAEAKARIAKEREPAQPVKQPKQRIEKIAEPAPPPAVEVHDISTADAHDEHEAKLDDIRAARMERLALEGRLPPAKRTTDAFGNPLDDNGETITEKSCTGNGKMPDFTTGDWPSLCADHEVPAEHCTSWLEREWSIGNQELYDSFELPPGCLP